ncbi:hypothetical protein V8G54_027085 [Vigna mungo]|uniref:Uncharacterized protein n=1 Tax=Vigna mungo TaxID=3915 RepID=A0AAQ3N1K4_VIGMU
MSLYAAFTNKQPPTKPKEPVVVKEPVIVKELSLDMKMFAQHLFEKGYFKDAIFSQSKKKFDLGWFTSFYAVCCKCTLQQTCKFRNQSVLNDNTNNLELVTVRKVITSYGLEWVHPQLVVPDVVRKSVSQLLKEIVKLSPST